MTRTVKFLRLPDAATRADLEASAPPGSHVPDAHLGPDGRWRGTAVVSDSHPDSAALKNWDRDHDLILEDLKNDT
jgi:hypothetical protein